jgi:hypothetical protein
LETNVSNFSWLRSPPTQQIGPTPSCVIPLP